MDAGTTLKLRGTITNTTTGKADVPNLLGDGSVVEVRSMHFKTYNVGDQVECVFRMKRDGDYTLVSATKVDPTARYQLFVNDVTRDQGKLLVVVCQRDFKWEADVTAAILKEVAKVDKLPVGAELPDITPLSPALTYEDAMRIAEDWRQAIPGLQVAVNRASRSARSQAEGYQPTATVRPAAPAPESVPEWLNGGTHWLSSDEREVLTVASNIIRNGKHVNLLLKGPSGYGKTSTMEAIARHLGVHCVTIDCSQILDPEAWFGYSEARDGSTIFEPTELTEAIERGNTIVILDEANRLSPDLSNPLFPILDHRKRTRVHNREIVVGPGVVFALTVNLGVKYAGTHVIDAALTNRIDMGIEVGPLPQRIEYKVIAAQFPALAEHAVNNILALVTELRKTVDKHVIDVDVSTRTSLKLALAMMNGMTIAQAAKHVIVTMAPVDERKALQDAIGLVVKGARP
jgi:MoxR-like ATPase